MGSRSVEKGNAAIASIAEEAPETKGMISVVQLDVQDDASVKAAAESIKASLGGEPLFAIVNNAGAGLAHGVDTGPILDVNLYGVKRVCDAIVPLLGPKGSRIVNVGSGIGPVAGRIRLSVDTPHCGVCWNRCLFRYVFHVLCFWCHSSGGTDHARICGADTTGLGICQSYPVRRINRPRVMDRDRYWNYWRIDFGFRDPGRYPTHGLSCVSFCPRFDRIRYQFDPSLPERSYLAIVRVSESRNGVCYLVCNRYGFCPTGIDLVAHSQCMHCMFSVVYVDNHRSQISAGARGGAVSLA